MKPIIPYMFKSFAAHILLMSGQPLKYQLAELKPEDFIAIPSLNIDIAKTKARAADGKVLSLINWYDTKLLIQSLSPDYFLPTSSQWSKAREYLQQNYPKLEKDFISGESEWVDSLLAVPDFERGYSSRLQIRGIKKEKDPFLNFFPIVPLLIEQSKVARSGNDYVLTEGKITEVPELPLFSGYIQSWNEDLGLPTKVGKNPNERFEGAIFQIEGVYSYSYYEGLNAPLRGLGDWLGNGRRFGLGGRVDLDKDVHWNPSCSASDVGFRLGRVASANEKR